MASLSKEEIAVLKRECQVDIYTGPGPGGQHRNKTRTAVRLHHRPSGLVVTATERRSLSQNLEAAFERLAARLKRLNRKDKPRRPTRPTGSSRKRRLQGKKLRSDTKKMRARPDQD
jgi:ribosome-associated protein